MRVLVTGASGFIGRVLCESLVQRGIEVTPAARTPAHLPQGTRFVSLRDLGPETVWEPALEACEAIVHLAARVHVMRDPARDPLAAFRRANVEATRRLAEAAARSGAARFVFLSTVKVHGEETRGPPFRESDRPAPEDAYALSKWEAEQVLAEIAARRRLSPVVLRPPLVYGPGVKGNFRALLALVARGLPLPFAAVSNRRSFLYVGNLADAIHRALVDPRAAGRTYLLSDGEDVSTPELIRRIARAMDRRALLFPAPAGLLRLVGRLTGGDAMRRLTSSLAVDASRIAAELGWRPPFAMDQGLAETAHWFAGLDGA